MLLFKTSLDNRKRFTIHEIRYSLLYIYENINENVFHRQIQNVEVNLKIREILCLREGEETNERTREDFDGFYLW